MKARPGSEALSPCRAKLQYPTSIYHGFLLPAIFTTWVSVNLLWCHESGLFPPRHPRTSNPRSRAWTLSTPQRPASPITHLTRSSLFPVLNQAKYSIFGFYEFAKIMTTYSPPNSLGILGKLWSKKKLNIACVRVHVLMYIGDKILPIGTF